MYYSLNTNSMSKCMSFVILMTAISEELIFGHQLTQQLDNRFEYKYSLKGPNLSEDNGSLHFWTLDGSAKASGELVLVTPSAKSKRGSLWTKSKTDFDLWTIELFFRVTGSDRFGGDGFAFWYTEEPLPEGPVFGSADNWKGLSLMFDSYDNDKKGNNPYIMAIVNNGSLSYNHSNDGLDQQLAGCLRDYRNKQFPTRVKIEYQKNVLTVMFHSGLTNSDNDYELCFRKEDVVLPKFGFFGISAATGDLADNHEVLKMLTYSLVTSKEADSTVSASNGEPSEAVSSEKAVNENEFNSIFKSSENTDEISKTSIDPLVYSSMSDDPHYTPTMTPTQKMFTVVDGTTFYDEEEDIEASAAIKPEPTTATKTPTISVKLPNIKDNIESNDSSVGLNSSVNDIHKSESTETSDVSAADSTEEIIAEEEIKNETVVENAENDSLSKEEKNINDKQNESSEVGTENNDTLPQIQTSTPEESHKELPNEDKKEEEKEVSSESQEVISPVSSEMKNESLNEDTKADNKSDSVETKESDSSTKSEEKVEQNEEKSQNITEEKENIITNSQEFTNNSLNISNDVSKDIRNDNIIKSESTDNEINDLNTNKSESLSEDSVDVIGANNNGSVVESAPTPDVEVSETNNVSVADEEPVKQNEELSIDKPLTDNDLTSGVTTNSSSSDEPKEELQVHNTDSVSPELTGYDSSTSETSESIQSVQNETNNDNLDDKINIPADPIPPPIELNHETPNQFSDIISAKDESKLLELNEHMTDHLESKVAPIVEEAKVAETIVETKDPEPVVEESVVSNEEPVIENKAEVVEEPKQEFVDQTVEQSEPKLNIESEKMFGWIDGMAVTQTISDIIPDDIELVLKQLQISPQMVVFIFVIAFNWCLMKLIVSVVCSSRKESELRNICCKAERQIYYFEAEKEKMQKEIDREKEKSQIAIERMKAAEHKVIPLEKEFTKLKNERDQLLLKVVNLETELETTAETASEANHLLNDFLNSQKENVNLSSSLEALQQQITKQSETVSKYESTAKQKEKENRVLKEKYEKLSAESERIKNLLKESENNLNILRTNNEELKASKNELNSSLTDLEEEYSRLENKSEELTQRNEQLSGDLQKLTEEMKMLREEKTNKELELESLKEILTKVRKPVDNNYSEDQTIEDEDEIDNRNCDQSLNDIYDIVKMEVQMKNLTNDKNELICKLEEVNQKCRQLNDKLVSLEENNNVLKTERESALQDRLKAQMELEVLTKYYKEKELELGKQIGVHHIQRQQKEEDAYSLSTQLATFEEENISLRSQLQSMKKEIEDTERKYKSQINQLEKQVHENWILARNAERKLDEAKAEATVLRQTLTMSVKSPVDGFGGDSSFMDDSASSISDHFGGGLPPPPPPPMPPMPPMIPPMMPPMAMHYDESDQTALWNQQMNPMVPPVPQHFPPMSAFNPIQTDIPMNTMNMNHSYQNSQPVSYSHQMANQWESTSNRDTYSPAMSHRSTSSPHPQYNMYSQTNNRYSNPMTTQMSSPMSSNSMNNHYQNSVTSPLVNTSPAAQSVNVFSEPMPSHWTQPHRPNGNISNLNYSQNSFNESDTSSRPESRTDRNDNSFHTSIV